VAKTIMRLGGNTALVSDITKQTNITTETLFVLNKINYSVHKAT